MWGRGHGAYNVLRILAEDKDNLVCCSVAISPIVDWKYHGKHLSAMNFSNKYF